MENVSLTFVLPTFEVVFLCDAVTEKVQVLIDPRLLQWVFARVELHFAVFHQYQHPVVVFAGICSGGTKFLMFGGSFEMVPAIRI